jgi:ABC-type transport system involved in cytochrome c biogenesis permease subunit
MHVIAFIVAIIAAVIFGVAYWLTKPRGDRGNLVALGLFLLTVAWILASIMVDEPHITVGG